MAYTTINKSGLYFNTKLYTGNGGSQSITGVGFQPDWIWFKKRNGAADSSLMDVVRGVRKSLTSNNNEAEYTESAGLSAFDSDGFSFDGSGYDHVNTNNDTFAGWCWKAGNSAGSSNSNGSITSTVSANTTAGFSIVSYTGTGSNATVGHGLGAVPKMIITKSRNNTYNWTSYHASLGNTGRIRLNSNSAADTGQTNWNSTTPTSSVFSVGTNADVNGSGNNVIAYCFAEKTGYSKFGSYTGNGNANGTFVYTGFKPAFVIIKNTDLSAENWLMHDSKRRTFNPNNTFLYPNLSNAEVVNNTYPIDLLSNGFKARNNNDQWNGSGHSYIYMAFGQTLVGSNNVPATAR